MNCDVASKIHRLEWTSVSGGILWIVFTARTLQPSKSYVCKDFLLMKPHLVLKDNNVWSYGKKFKNDDILKL